MEGTATTTESQSKTVSRESVNTDKKEHQGLQPKDQKCLNLQNPFVQEQQLSCQA